MTPFYIYAIIAYLYHHELKQRNSNYVDTELQKMNIWTNKRKIT